MTKKYQICHHQIRFSKLKMHQNPFSGTPLGELTTLPQTPSAGDGNTPSPFLSPLDAFGVWNSAPAAPRFSTQNPGKSQ